MTGNHSPKDQYLPKGTCQKIKDLRLSEMDVPALKRTHHKLVNASTKDRNGPELSDEIKVCVQKRAVDELKTRLWECEVAFKSVPPGVTEGMVKDAKAALVEPTAALETFKRWLDDERVEKETKRCKRILDNCDVPIENKRRAKDALFMLELTGTTRKSAAMSPTEYVKKFKEEAEWLAAELKAAESKVEEFHSELVNEQATNKKLKAKLERSEAIIKKLVA